MTTDISAAPRQAGMTGERLRDTPGAKAGMTSARGRKTAKFDRKLVEILRAAAAVFAEVGYDPASIRMVADRAGVSVAGLYYYVRSKDELLYLIQYHVFDGLVRRFEDDSARMLAGGGGEALGGGRAAEHGQAIGIDALAVGPGLDLDMDREGRFTPETGELGSNVIRLDLSEAEKHGTLYATGSTYTAENDAVYDGISREGIRLVTMAGVLKHGVFPLAETLKFLLNIGEEESKGTEVIQEAYQLLEDSDLNFIGNIEGRDILTGKADVVVCDGFTGNVILKFGESLARMVSKTMKKTIRGNLPGTVGMYLIRPSLRKLFKLFDYQEYGGAPLLGIKGTCIIGHGSSKQRAIKNAVEEAWKMVTEKVSEHIEKQLAKRKGE